MQREVIGDLDFKPSKIEWLTKGGAWDRARKINHTDGQTRSNELFTWHWRIRHKLPRNAHGA